MSENSKETIQTELDMPWHEAKSKKGEFLLKGEGLNYYLVLSEPKAYENTLQDGRVFKSVNMDAHLLKIVDLSGQLSEKSPVEPEKGILSISFPMVEDLVKYMKKNSMPLKSIVGNVLVFLRIGLTKNDTTYSQIALLSVEEYESRFPKVKK